MTTQQQWAEVEAAFDTVLSLPQSEWRAACRRLAAGNEQLHAELVSLVACVGGFDPVLDVPVTQGVGVGAVVTPGRDDAGSLAPGVRLGAYRVLQLIGRGGMGEVYLAERADGQFEQRVALKLITREAAAHLDRFQMERQILARLEHPGIARLLDAGVTSDERPYMIMELVVGRPILQWCREQRCDLTQRLQLFTAICDAVAYAHRNLIVHRDLKPANVLVNAEGAVKLLDFGVAKSLGEGITEQTLNAPATPAYAAPEQLTGGSVTTATDVYALGLLLFELLAGQRPWQLTQLPLATGLEKVLRETAPAPSERAARNPDAPVPPALLRGDLDAIIAKALRKEPDDRYESVAALQLDIARSQRAEPVAARSRARLYVLGRFLRRHRVAAATVAFVVILAIAAGVAVTTQAQRAQREAARATAARNFLISVFNASDPRRLSSKPRGEITAKDLLDANAGRIPREFANDPVTEIDLLGIVSAIYRELGEVDRYRATHEQMLSLARKQYGASSPIVLEALLDEVEFLESREDLTLAQRKLVPLDALIHQGGLDRSRLRARWWLESGVALSATSTVGPERLVMLQRAAAMFASVAPRDPRYVTALSEIGTFYTASIDLPTAVAYFRQAIEVAEQVNDRNDAELQTIYSNMGMALQQHGDLADADAAFTKSETIATRTYGELDRVQWIPVAQHALVLHQMGPPARALALFAKLMKVLPAPGEHDHDAAYVRETYAGCLTAEGRAQPSIEMLEDALATYQVKAQFSFESARAIRTLGNAYDLAGRESEARAMLKQALDARIATVPADGQALLQARESWGRFLVEHGEAEGAAAQFREIVAQDRGRHLAHTALAYGGLARVALINRDGGAVDYARRGVDAFDHVQGFRDARMGPYLWDIYAQALLAAGAAQAAAMWARSALAADRAYDDPASPDIAHVEGTLRAAVKAGSAAPAHAFATQPPRP